MIKNKPAKSNRHFRYKYSTSQPKIIKSPSLKSHVSGNVRDILYPKSAYAPQIEYTPKLDNTWSDAAYDTIEIMIKSMAIAGIITLVIAFGLLVKYWFF